ncbi:hypothetical protein J7369_14280 [Xanthomonas phaseoli pv. dieffenbachiae]|uniref:hypothetical protein n=1 Tax=Xanthomonas phaseoli TaxID=1985254 RepID=UPI001ADAA95E|nr:hypothetical protein [Xanthomonas phaseoli]MBO9898854.1 hypothetical protein [Xanthomonas phaseoli pv. dieffenbachiae]
MRGNALHITSLLLIHAAALLALPASAQVAVTIDRSSLGLVGGSVACPADAVIFVTAGNQVQPVCNRPEPTELEHASVTNVAKKPPAPTWVALDGAPVRATLLTWLPKDWRLAWDTKADPRAPGVRANGSFLDAVKSLFATRAEWGVGLEAQAFPDEKILQIRDASNVLKPQQLPLAASSPIHKVAP